MQHLLVSRFVVKWNNRYAVVNLIGEGVNRVIHNNHVLHLSIPDNPQILYIITFGCLYTMLSVQSILKKFVLRVDVVQNCIRIGLMACSENNYLKLFVRFLEALHQIRSQVNASTDCLLPWEVNLKNYIRVLCFNVVDTVDQGLVHIEDQDFLVALTQCWWQVNELVSDVILPNESQIVVDELKGLESVFEVLPV